MSRKRNIMVLEVISHRYHKKAKRTTSERKGKRIRTTRQDPGVTESGWNRGKLSFAQDLEKGRAKTETKQEEGQLRQREKQEEKRRQRASKKKKKGLTSSLGNKNNIFDKWPKYFKRDMCCQKRTPSKDIDGQRCLLKY